MNQHRFPDGESLIRLDTPPGGREIASAAHAPHVVLRKQRHGDRFIDLDQGSCAGRV